MRRPSSEVSGSDRAPRCLAQSKLTVLGESAGDARLVQLSSQSDETREICYIEITHSRYSSEKDEASHVRPQMKEYLIASFMGDEGEKSSPEL